MFRTNKNAIQILLGLVVGFLVSFSLCTITSKYTLGGLLEPSKFTLVGPMRRFSMFLTMVIVHTLPCWILFLFVLGITISFFIYLYRPICQKRYFIAVMLGSSLLWIYFAILLEDHFNSNPNPVPSALHLFFEPRFQIAHELWYYREVTELIGQHLELSIIPLVPIFFVTFIDWRKRRREEIAEINPSYSSLIKPRVAISAVTLTLSGITIWLLIGRGVSPEEQLVVVATTEIPAGTILVSKDLAVVDSATKIDGSIHSVHSIVGRKTKLDRISAGKVIYDEYLEPKLNSN